MEPRIYSGQLVTVEPITDPWKLKIGDIVLCKVKGKSFLHSIWDDDDGRPYNFLIGNERGFSNGWTKCENIFGKVVKIAP